MYNELSPLQGQGILQGRKVQPIGLWWRHMASYSWISVGLGKGLSPVQRQTITWTNVDLLSMGARGQISLNSNKKK